MVPELEDLTCEGRLQEMHPLLKESERGDLSTICKSMNNVDEIDWKYLMIKGKNVWGDTRINCKKKFSWTIKEQLSPEKYRYLKTR